MKPAASALLLALLVQDPVCDHGSRGATRPVDLKEVARIQEEAARAFKSLSFAKAQGFSWPPFDSGLPACRSRAVRRLRVETLPPDMKPLLFAPAGSDAPPEAIRVATRARSIAEASIPADKELAARFGVRCWPSLVRPVTTSEVEISEGWTP